MKQLLLVFLGGGLGSVARLLVSKWLNYENGYMPYGTFLVNVLGSFLIGLILGMAVKNESMTQNQLLFFATGFCGGFTTFSAFAYENHLFLKTGDFVHFIIYTTASFVFGLVAVFFGVYLIK